MQIDIEKELKKIEAMDSKESILPYVRTLLEDICSLPMCYTVREVSNKWKIAPHTIMQWVGDGKIKILALPYSLGGRRIIRITEKSLLDFLKENKKNGRKKRDDTEGDSDRAYFEI